MKRNEIYKLTLAAVFAALCFVATVFFNIKLPGNGYANLGDCFVVTAGFALGGIYGGAAAAIGSALSDIFLGYVIYAPATFVIKGLMAVAAFLVYKAFKNRTGVLKLLGILLGGLVAEIVMVFGYFVFELVLYGFKTAAVDIAGNSAQGIVGLITSFILFSILDRTKILKMLESKKK